ncbi:MAG: CAP domain-containing protein, partial [Terriglobia bacterium]
HYFSHTGPNGDSPIERFYKAGIQWRAMGENIVMNQNAVLAELALMNEPPSQHNHRHNILNPEFNYVGIGVARAPDGSVCITQDFAQEDPRDAEIIVAR